MSFQVKTSIKWRGKEFERAVRRGIGKNVRDAGRFLQGRIQHNLSRQGGPDSHSRPGQYPFRITGELQRGIKMDFSDDSEPIATIESTAPHSQHVEKIRPFMLKSYYSSLGIIRSILTRKLKL